MTVSKHSGWITRDTPISYPYVGMVAVLTALAWCSACRSAASPTAAAASPTPADTGIPVSIATATVPSVAGTPASLMPPTPSPTPFLTGYNVELPTETTVSGYPAPYNPPTAMPTALVAPTVMAAVNAISPDNAADLRPVALVGPPSFAGAEQMASWWQSDFGPVLDSVFSPDGNRLAVAKAYGVFLFDLHALQPMRFIDTGNAIPMRVFFMADGENLLVSTHETMFGARGATFFDISSGQRAGLIRWGPSVKGIDSTIPLVNNPLDAGEQGAWIYQIVPAPDGKSLISASKDGTLVRISADGTLSQEGRAPFGGQAGELTSTDISGDGLRIAAGSSDGTVKL